MSAVRVHWRRFCHRALLRTAAYTVVYTPSSPSCCHAPRAPPVPTPPRLQPGRRRPTSRRASSRSCAASTPPRASSRCPLRPIGVRSIPRSRSRPVTARTAFETSATLRSAILGSCTPTARACSTSRWRSSPRSAPCARRPSSRCRASCRRPRSPRIRTSTRATRACTPLGARTRTNRLWTRTAPIACTHTSAPRTRCGAWRTGRPRRAGSRSDSTRCGVGDIRRGT